MAPTGPPSFVPGNRVPGYPVIRLRLFFIFLLPIVDGYRLFPVNNRRLYTPRSGNGGTISVFSHKRSTIYDTK
jgi:hypothetical protein